MRKAVPVGDMCIDALAVAAEARSVRIRYARRSTADNSKRIQAIEAALGNISAAMAPIRSELGKHAYLPGTTSYQKRYFRLLDASKALQKESRKLKKMQSYDAR